MKVSIIVPVYNVDRYLSNCVDSLLNQDFNEYEILLIDDGSTDTSSDICDLYSSKYSNVRAYHKTNGGLSSARNYGLDKASGDWIIFVDSDDYWCSQHVLSTLVTTAETTGVDLVRFEYIAVDEQGRNLYQYEYKKDHLLNKVLTQYELFHSAIAGEFFAWLYLIKRDLIAEMRFDEGRKFQEDIDFYLRLIATRLFKSAYCNKRLYAYRKRENSITSTPNTYNLSGSFSLADVFYEYSKYISDNKLKREYLTYAVMMYYWTLFTIAEPIFYKIRSNIYKEVNINQLYGRALKRMCKFGIFTKASILILIPPKISVGLIYAKTVLSNKLKRRHEK